MLVYQGVIPTHRNIQHPMMWKYLCSQSMFPITGIKEPILSQIYVPDDVEMFAERNSFSGCRENIRGMEVVTRKGIINKTMVQLTWINEGLIINHTIPIIGRYLQNMTITSQTADYVVGNRFVSVFFYNFYVFLIL